MSGLPGDGGRLRGWWFLFRPHLNWTVLFLVCAVVYGVLVAAQWDAAGPLFAAGGVAFALWWWLSSRYARVGVAVTDTRQAQVHALVRETAARLDAPMPDRVWLGHDTRVIGRVRHGWRELVIGVPAVYALTRAELAALVAHELAVLDTGGSTMAIRLYRHWAASMEQAAHAAEGSPSAEDDAAALRTLGPLGQAIEGQADGRLPDARAAASAVLRFKPMTLDFYLFHNLTRSELTEPVNHRRYAIEDLHDGWRRRVAVRGGQFAGLTIDAGDAAAVGRLHPGLAAAARALVGHPLEVTVPVDAIPVMPLSRRDRRLLSKMACIDPRWHRRRRWRTFETAPAQLWSRTATARVRPVLDAVTRILGRKPESGAEAADVVRNRPIEVAMECNPDWSAEDLDADKIRAGYWALLLEAALLGRGWLRADPAVPNVLRAPGDTELDGTELSARAVAEPAAYAELLQLLTGGRRPHDEGRAGRSVPT